MGIAVAFLLSACIDSEDSRQSNAPERSETLRSEAKPLSPERAQAVETLSMVRSWRETADEELGLAVDRGLSLLAEEERDAFWMRVDRLVEIRKVVVPEAIDRQEAFIAVVRSFPELEQAALLGLRNSGLPTADRPADEIVSAMTPAQFRSGVDEVCVALADASPDTVKSFADELGISIPLSGSP